jgi:hypothetical protein
VQLFLPQTLWLSTEFDQCPQNFGEYISLSDPNQFYLWEMLASAPEALVKHINMEISPWNLCIQYVRIVKSSIPNINFVFDFLFGMLNKAPGGTH